MAFHPNKCSALSVTRHKYLINFNYTLHGHPLKSLEETKYIGLTIRQDLKWKSYVNNVCTKATKTLDFPVETLSSVRPT
jgi:hypothetical protein